MDFDAHLIAQSISKQYHILPSAQPDMHYSDWALLVGGLMRDTPLGRVIEIRAEKNSKVIRQFGAHEKHIRAEWSRFKSQKATRRAGDPMTDIARLQGLLARMFS